MANKVLVTGGAGFIGSHVSESLINKQYEVVILDDLSGGFIDNIPQKATFVKGSINDQVLVKEIFKNYQFDYVFHLAAYAAEGLSHFIKRYNYENNLVGSVNLINESINNNIKCFVFTSSIAVYGKNQLPMSEDMIPMPEDSYGIAKYAIEQELAVSKRMFGLDYIIFRPHNVYGEKQNIGDKYRNVIGIFMNQAMQNQNLSIFGDGKQTRAFSYIKDIAPAMASSIENTDAYGQVFNIGADIPYSVNELASKVLKVMNKNSGITYLDARNEVVHAYSSHEKFKNYFPGFESHTLEYGLKEMANWAIKVGARRSKEFDNIEIYKNLPKSWLPK